MPAIRQSRALFRVAVLTLVITVIGITIGALVTTKDAGMAFRDWPTSDGENMLLFDWFGLLAGSIDKTAWNKFWEHGHRLAGMLIGIVSLALAFTAWRTERRGWLKGLAYGVLACVIIQGILGGARVLMDKRYMAMIHGNFGALVVVLMGLVAFGASRSWRAVAESKGEPAQLKRGLWSLAFLVPAVVYTQYVLGGMLRHLGLALWEHVVMAGVVLLTVLAATVVSARSGSPFLRRGGVWLLIVAVLQLGIGLGTFATKLGVPWLGEPAVAGSIESVAFRTSHTVVGMLLLMTSVLFSARIFRWTHLHGRGELSTEQTDHLAASAGGIE